MKSRMLLALLSFCAVLPAYALDDIDSKQSVQPILVQQHAIRDDIEAKRGRWAKMSPDKRGEVLKRQERVFELLKGHETIATLPQKQQMEVANLLEEIKATANGTPEERRICTRERRVGSNFVQRTCRTESQMRAEREAVRDGIRRNDELRRQQPRDPTGF